MLAFFGAFSFGGTILNQYHYALGQLSFYFLVLALVTSNFRPSSRSLLWISLFVGYCLISALIGCYFGDGLCSRKPYTAVIGILLLYFGIEYVAYCVERYPKFVDQTEKYLIAACWIVVFLSIPYLIARLIHNPNVTSGWQSWVNEIYAYMNISGRFKGLTQEPARLGMVIATLYPIVFIRLNEKFSIPRLILALGLWGCLLIATTRTGVAACLLLTLLMLLFYPKRLFIFIGFIVIFYFSALSMVIVYIPEYLHLLGWFEKSVDASTSVRSAHTLGALNVWKSFPFFGVGLGQSGFVLSDFYPSWYGPNSYEYTTWVPLKAVGGVPSFSFLPQALAEIGLIGFGILFLGVFRLAKQSILQIKSNLIIRMYFFSFAGFLITSFGVDGYLYIAAWLILGVLLGVIRHQSKSNFVRV